MTAEIIVPKHENDGSDNAAVIGLAARRVCAMSGRATVYDARGPWLDAQGRLCVDPVSVIVSAATDAGQARAALTELAREVLAMTDQLTVFVSVGDVAEIIA